MKSVLPDVAASDQVIQKLSHELRTPLTSIKAAVRMVAMGVHGDLNDEQHSVLDLALMNIDRLGRMLNEVLDWRKMAEGCVELRRERVDVYRLLRELVRSFEPLAADRGLRLRLETPLAQLDGFLDRDKISQVFTNLLHNAIKFTESGEVVVELLERPGVMEIRVSDTGPGIRPDDLSRLFGPFRQLGHKAHTGEKGTGLGLTLAKQIVELHGGTIRAENIPSRGTQFIILLPQMQPIDVFKEETKRLLIHTSAPPEIIVSSSEVKQASSTITSPAQHGCAGAGGCSGK